MDDPTKPVIFIVSDGRGETCRQVVHAALVQFEGQQYDLQRRGLVRNPGQVKQVVDEAAAAKGLIFYTLVADDTRQAMSVYCEEKLVHAVDLLGPSFTALRDLFKSARTGRPGLLYESDRETFDRIEAIDYTLKHDDGRRPHDLAYADVVLVGVSRSSKSSTCFYLAYYGICAANVPLFADIDPPQELLEVDRDKVIGLVISPRRLRALREARVNKMHGKLDMSGYLDEKEITREILVTNEMMKSYGWRRINVSYQAIEEVAKEVIRMRGLEMRRPPR